LSNNDTNKNKDLLQKLLLRPEFKGMSLCESEFFDVSPEVKESVPPRFFLIKDNCPQEALQYQNGHLSYPMFLPLSEYVTEISEEDALKIYGKALGRLSKIITYGLTAKEVAALRSRGEKEFGTV
jgi:hypothetical protein